MPIAAASSSSTSTSALTKSARKFGGYGSATLRSTALCRKGTRLGIGASDDTHVSALVIRIAKVFITSDTSIYSIGTRGFNAFLRATGTHRATSKADHRGHAWFKEHTRSSANFDAVHNFSGLIAQSFVVLGKPSVDATSLYVASADYTNGDVRKSFGLLVYATDVNELLDLAEVPVDRHLLVSASFTGGPGDPLYDIGASPHAIGKRIRTRGGTTIVFRAPLDNEVAIDVKARMLLRFEREIDTGEGRWREYRSMPQRFLDGIAAPELFDPDGILNFYALVYGAAMSTWSYDNFLLAEQRDPDRVVRQYLPFLAADYGSKLNGDAEESVNRALARSAVPVAKIGGTDRSVSIRLAALGYLAVVHEVWVNPGHPLCRIDADNNGAQYNTTIVYTPGPLPDDDAGANVILVATPRGGGDNAKARGWVLFRDGLSPADGDTLVVTDGVNTVSFEFDDRRVEGVITSAGGSSFGGTLAHLAVQPSTVSINFATDTGTVRLTDNGAGVLTVTETSGTLAGMTLSSGAVNYATGVWSAVFTIPVGAVTITTLHTSTNPVVAVGATPVLVGASGDATMATFISVFNASVLAYTATVATATGNYQAGVYPNQVAGVEYPGVPADPDSPSNPPATGRTSSAKGAGTVFVTMPHGQRNIHPEPPYFPSSRIALYVSLSDGSPFVTMTASDKRTIADAIAPILPAHVDVRLVGTAVNANGDNDHETLTIEETFSTELVP